MGIRWADLTLEQRAMIEGRPLSPTPPTTQTLKRSRLERDEQRIFANWCLLNALPFCWHATHKRSTATTGVFDFWVGKHNASAWIEFKMSSGKLRPEQEAFRLKLVAQGLDWHVVNSAREAIGIVKGWP